MTGRQAKEEMRMNHETIEYGKKQTPKFKRCTLIVLCIPVMLMLTMTGLSLARAQSLSVSPTGGPAGTVVTLSGSGFLEGYHHYCLSSSSSSVSCVAGTDHPFSIGTSGNISGWTLTVPSGTAPGSYYVIVYVPIVNAPVIRAYAPFTVTTSSPPPTSATLSLTPSSVAVGTSTTVTLSGAGYAPPGTNYGWCLSNSAPTIGGKFDGSTCVSPTSFNGAFPSDASGNIMGGANAPSFTVFPPPLNPGTYYVVVFTPPTLAPPAVVVAFASFTVTTTVPPPPSSCGFVLSVAPVSQTVVQGETAIFGLSMSVSNPSCTSVSLTNLYVTGLGPGMDWQMGPSEASVAITTSPMTPPGTYPLSLTFSVNGVPQQTGFTLTVTQAPTTTTTSISTATSAIFDYSVTVSPSTQSVEIGGSTSYIVSVLPIAGSPVPVSLNVTGCPGDVRSSFTTQSAIPPYTSTLTLDLSTSTANAGAYTLTVLATAAGGNVKSATTTLMIQQKPTQTTVAQTTTSGSSWSNVPQQNSLIIIIAALVLAVVLGVLVMRSRGRRKATQQVGAPRTFCGKCGTENPASSEFCTSCGNKLKES
jgi:hypothetical protein